MNSRRQFWVAVCWSLLSAMAVAQTVSLETAETRLQFEAGPNAPRLSSLQNGTFAWQNRAAETLIPSVEIIGQSVPIEWKFNSADSHADKNLVSFVYDAASPLLRLTWEWQ